MAGSLCLLLLIGALCGPAAAFGSDRAGRQRAADVLTEKLFAVADMLTAIEQHVQRLDGWESDVSALQTRLDALEAGQRQAAAQLTAVLGRLENVTAATAGVPTELSSLAVSQASTAAELSTLRQDLSQSVAGLAETLSGLADSQTAHHERTRGACSVGEARLSAPLLELQAAVNGSAELVTRTEQALTSGLKGIDGRLQRTSQQLDDVAEQLRQERESRLTSTTPAPTVDPQQAFLNSLYRSLSKRKGSQ